MAVGLSVMGGGQVREMSVLVNEPGLAKGRPWPLRYYPPSPPQWGMGRRAGKEEGSSSVPLRWE